MKKVPQFTARLLPGNYMYGGHPRGYIFYIEFMKILTYYA